MRKSNKTEKISFRCTREEKAKIEENAEANNMSRSSFIVKAASKTDTKSRHRSKDIAALCRMASFVSQYEDGFKREEVAEKLVQEVKAYVHSQSGRK